MSLLGCPIDCRPAIFVSGVSFAASSDESLDSPSPAPHGCQEEGGYSIIVHCILVTSSISKTIWSWRAVTVVIPVIHSICVCTQQLLLIGCCSSAWLEREESDFLRRSSWLVCWTSLICQPLTHVSSVHCKQNGRSAGENWPSFILLFLHQVGSEEHKEDITVIRYHSCTTACLKGFNDLLRLRTILPSWTSLK